MSGRRVGVWAVAALAAGCMRPTFPVRPEAFHAEQGVEGAEVTLRDSTRFTLDSPRVEGPRLVGAEVAGCEGGRCPGIAATRGVSLSEVRATEVWYRRAPPAARIDFDVGVPYAVSPLGVGIRGTLGLGVGLRAASRSGFGAALRFGYAGEYHLSNYEVVTAHAEGWVADAVGFYRVRARGDDHHGLGVDLSLGLSVADLEWNAGRSASSCPLFHFGSDCGVTTPYTPPPQGFSSGMRVGPTAGISLDGRFEVLVIGASFAYHALVYADPSPIAAEPAALQVVTLFAHVGFGLSL